MNPTSAAVVLAWVAIVILALSSAGLLRQVRYLTHELTALKNGAQPSRVIESTAVPEVLAKLLPLDDVGSIVLVLDADCVSCQTIARELAEAPPTFQRSLLAVLGGQGFERDARRMKDGGVEVITDSDRELSRMLSVSVTPYVLAVNAAHEIFARRPVGNLDQLVEFSSSVFRKE